MTEDQQQKHSLPLFIYISSMVSLSLTFNYPFLLFVILILLISSFLFHPGFLKCERNIEREKVKTWIEAIILLSLLPLTFSCSPPLNTCCSDLFQDPVSFWWCLWEGEDEWKSNIKWNEKWIGKNIGSIFKTDFWLKTCSCKTHFFNSSHLIANPVNDHSSHINLDLCLSLLKICVNVISKYCI